MAHANELLARARARRDELRDTGIATLLPAPESLADEVELYSEVTAIASSLGKIMAEQGVSPAVEIRSYVQHGSGPMRKATRLLKHPEVSGYPIAERYRPGRLPEISWDPDNLRATEIHRAVPANLQQLIASPGQGLVFVSGDLAGDLPRQDALGRLGLPESFTVHLGTIGLRNPVAHPMEFSDFAYQSSNDGRGALWGRHPVDLAVNIVGWAENNGISSRELMAA